LLYRATSDGSYPKDYHKKCDNQGPTLTLIKTDNNRKFGGYVSKTENMVHVMKYMSKIRMLSFFLLIKKRNII